MCATCAGFIIIFEKLKKISGKVDALVNTVKSSNQIQTNFELNKILSEHANMLDSRKTKNDYSEEKMRILVDDEFNVLKMLIDTFLLETTNERNNLVLSIYSLASMLTVSIMYFDELYYYNNKDRISNGEYWHSSHNRWMSELDRLSSAEFISKIQDYVRIMSPEAFFCNSAMEISLSSEPHFQRRTSQKRWSSNAISTIRSRL